MLSKIQSIASLFNYKTFRLRFGHCLICGKTIFIKLDNYPIAVRCVRCKASAVTLSLISVLNRIVPDLQGKHVYELSSRGPLVNFLLKKADQVTLSEYFDDIPRGQFRNGVQCQNVEKLTYPDNQFDLCTSTEVFEHVPNDSLGFREMYRVLKPGGTFIFTVPMTHEEKTVERVKIVDGKICHILPPEYHGDRIRGAKKVLCFRNYGLDIVARLKQAGFREPQTILADDLAGWGITRRVVVGYK